MSDSKVEQDLFNKEEDDKDEKDDKDDNSEEENEEDEDEEEDEEPKLKYERIGNSFQEILTEDAASCMTVHPKVYIHSILNMKQFVLTKNLLSF